MAVDQQGLLARLVRELVRLPGIGQKTAQRLAFHVLKAEREDALRLAEAIRAVKTGSHFADNAGTSPKENSVSFVSIRSGIRRESS